MSNQVYKENESLGSSLCDALDCDNGLYIRNILKNCCPTEIVDSLVTLNYEQRKKFFHNYLDSHVLVLLPLDLKTEVIEIMGVEFCIGTLSICGASEAYLFLEDLKREVSECIIALMPKEIRVILEELFSYPEDSAGRLISKDFVLLPRHWTVQRAIEVMKSSKSIKQNVYHLFVVDSSLHPIGMVGIYELLCAPQDELISDIMVETFKVVKLGSDQEEVARLFNDYSLKSAAVIDDFNCIIGVISVDEVLEIIKKEAEEDIMHLGGVGERDISAGVFRTAFRRLPWLLITFFAINIASVFVQFFQEVLVKAIELSMLMPIIAALSGNAGLQASTIALRSIMTRQLNNTNVMRVLCKELATGFINGSILATFMVIIIAMRFGDQTLELLFAVAMIVVFTLATFIGAMVPVLLNKIGFDPAFSSSAVISSITDILALCTLLQIASLFLN